MAPAAAADPGRPPREAGPALVTTDRLLAEVTGSAATMARLIGGADLTTAVPTCPEWTLRQLATHTGRAHRWAAAIVTTRAAEPIGFREVPDGKLPADPARHQAWLTDGASRLSEAVRGAGTAQVWTFRGLRPAGFWARRMAHETAVHRADAQIACGEPPVIDPVIAADGVDEWLGFLGPADPQRGRPPALPDGKVLHLHATDDGVTGEWVIRGVPGGIAVETGHAKGDTAVRGPASALLLVLLRRLPPGDGAVEVIGDRALLDGWLAATPF